MQHAFPVPAARPAFWIAIVYGILTAAAIFLHPVEGAVSAALFFGAAWGIRRAQPWAAVTLACLLAVPVIVAELSPFGAPRAAIGMIVLAYWPLRAALNLFRLGAPAQRPWPWIAILAACACFWLGFTQYVTPSASMERTILAGDYLLVETATWRLGRTPGPGDLVMFRYPVDRKQTFIKRVAGAPGDRLRIVDKQLYRNGAAVPEPYATHTTDYLNAYRDNFPAAPDASLPDAGAAMLRDNVRGGEVIVPPGQYFVLGDNRDNSLDSRYFGFVPRADILGSPVLVYASYDFNGQPPPKTLPTILNTRWSRLLRAL